MRLYSRAPLLLMDRRLLVLYLLSGLAALGIETIWMRWLRELLGATAPAVSATLIAFFAGHALGAWWSGRRARRFARPLRAYGRIELLAAAGAALVPVLIAAGDTVMRPAYDTLRGSPVALQGTRLMLALLATLPASFCFGASFPAIGEAAVGPTERLGTRGSALYAVNIVGAAVGAAITAFVLPGLWGVGTTYGTSVILLVGVGAGAVLLDRHRPARPEMTRKQKRPDKRAPGPRSSQGRLTKSGLAGLAALSGFCAFALQVLAVQALAQVLNGSIYAFGAVTVTVLVALALGAGVVWWVERRSSFDPITLLGTALVATALLIALFPAALMLTTRGLSYVGAGSPGFPYLTKALGTAFITAGPGVLAGGLVLPLTFALGGRLAKGDDRDSAGGVLGKLVAINTVGALAGALCTPYLLMPVFGLWGAFFAVGSVYGIAAIALPDQTSRTKRWRLSGLAVGATAVFAFASPARIASSGLGPQERLVSSETTPSGVVDVVERPDGRLLRIDNHYALGGTAEQVHEERQAHLPLVLTPHARRVAYIGAATGISAGAALDHALEKLYLVELVPGVVRAARAHFADANRSVYDAEVTEVVVDDARNFFGATRERFDLVVADLFVPWRAGTGSLYTLEHFSAVRDHLLPDGVFVQWLALYQLSQSELEVITATFLDVFPRAALFRGDFYGGFPIAALVGFRGTPAAPSAIAAAAQRLGRAGVRDRWVTDPLGVWALYVGPLAPMRSALDQTPRNRDDLPWVEWNAAAGHAGGDRGKVNPVVGLVWTGFTDKIRARARTVADPVFPQLGPAEKRAELGGAFLQRAGALWVAGQTQAASNAFAKAATLLPPRLVAGANPDETAAELWSAE